MHCVRWSILVVSLMFSLTAQSQVFWSVTDDEGRQNWLLGTVHSEDPRLLEFPPELLDALGRADRLALELVPDAAMLEQLQRAMHFDDGGLDEVLEPELYAEVVRILEQGYGMGEPAVRRLRPWAAAMTISVPPPQTGLFMDLALSFRAGGMGLEVLALETIDEQLDFLKGLSHEGQIELVRSAVAEHGRMPVIFEELVSAYLDGNLSLLEALSMRQLADLDEEIVEHFHEIGLVRRNHIMVDRAMPYLKQGGLVIAVGALHLVGEDGLVALLEQRGFEVEGIY